MELDKARKVGENANIYTIGEVKVACGVLLEYVGKTETELKRVSDIVDRQNLAAAEVIKNHTLSKEQTEPPLFYDDRSMNIFINAISCICALNKDDVYGVASALCKGGMTDRGIKEVLKQLK